MRELRDRFELLTPREHAVMQLVVSGRLNKQIGGELGITEITVKAPRTDDAEGGSQFTCSLGKDRGEATKLRLAPAELT
jgi:hypothetical protein